MYEEFHHLYLQLCEHPDQFFTEIRMSIQTFDYLWRNITAELWKKGTNFRKAIIPDEQLYVTIQ